MTDMSAAAVAERAVARMTEFVRVWKCRGRPAIIARVEENPAAISAPEKTLTVYDIEAVLAENAGLRARAEKAEDALVGATEANAMLRGGITKVRAESAELREEIEDLVRRGNSAFGERDRARAEVAALRGQITSELDDIAEELKQRADGSGDPTGRTILLVQADAVDAAAGRIRSQS